MLSYATPGEVQAGGPAPAADELALIEGLRQGDEAAFGRLIERYHRTLFNLALYYVQERTAAEDIVQETWLGVIQGIERFEGRASLKTWLCRIAANRARTRGSRDARTAPFSAVWTVDDEAAEPSVEAERFLQTGALAGHWQARPESWAPIPEAHLLSNETLARVREAIAGLPANQRLVITLRDVEGWAAEEVCQALDLTAVHQRVLLHRARSKVRAALERYFAAVAAP